MFEKAWLWVLLVSVVVSLLVSLRTQLKEKRITFRLVAMVTGSVIGRGLVFFIVICAPLFRQPRLETGLLLPIVGSVIGILGIILVFVATHELSRTNFSGTRGIPARVITTGPYRLVRHPATIGFVAIYAGWCLAWGAVYALYSVPALALILVLETFWEEKNLIRELGKEYLDYRQKVGMFFPKRRQL
jgi:protein-S-isoprenylcysteine O-methyltransferase Ste14